jgi:epidermal growth factor receptor substrate 15
VDPSNQGSVGALDAAKFLKKSGLSDVILSKVWDLSDPAGKGYLNKGGFFVALKLVSLAQTGKDVNMVNITADVPPPKMVGPKIFYSNILTQYYPECWHVNTSRCCLRACDKILNISLSS